MIMLILFPHSIWANPKITTSFIQGYNSKEAGLEDPQSASSHKKIYGILQIKGLRRAISPRYARILDFNDTSRKGKVLKKGILFTYAAFKSRHVVLSGNFNNWSKITLKRGKYGVFYYILPIREIEFGKKILDYEYKFQVDGVWINDPKNKNKSDDGLGGYTSIFHLPDYDANKRISTKVLISNGYKREKLIEFAIYKPRSQNLSLVGDFNNWNPEMDPLLKGKDGVFRLRKRLKPGTYYYKYVVDGNWILDTFNPNTNYHKGLEELTSTIMIDE